MNASPVPPLVLVLALATAAHAQPAPDFALITGQTQTTQIFGVTAAWAVDASVVDVYARQGSVTLFGRTAGRTTLVVVSVAGEQHYPVIVSAPAGTAGSRAAAHVDQATAEVRYSSAAREIQNSVAATRADAGRRVEAALRTIHHPGEPQGDRVKTSVAAASYRIFTPGRELTFFDRDVDHSPLTLDATPLRGIHYLDQHWRLHAGYTAYAAYRSFLLPVERQLVAGGGYAFRTGARSTLTPSLFAIRGEGTVASLLYESIEPDRLFIRGEVGYSHGLGGAAEVAWDSTADHLRAAVRYRPEDFAVAGTATPRGFFGDASWTHAYGRDSAASASASATDALGMRVLASAADVDHRLGDVLALTGGASWASFEGRRTLTVPAGIRIDLGRGGIAALYRYTSAFNNDGGHEFRVSGRLSRGHLHASAFADRQANAPTLEVIFSERPDLALALAELGIVATSPADVARALREQAVLRELGFIDGVTLELAPVRMQTGLEAAFLGTSPSRQQFRARVLRSVTESVASRTTTLIATLSYSRRLTAATDVFGAWSYWRIDSAAGGARVQPFFEAGVRQRFDGLPAVFGGGAGTISGNVFLDEDLDGRSDGSDGVLFAEVELDGARRQRTGGDGSFRFTGVPRGAHRLVARIPERPDAYFTTPSRVEAEPGDRVAFGVASTPARLFGRLLDDAGGAIAGVRVLLLRGAQQHAAVTGSDGRFTFAAAPGAWELAIVADSVPPGYSLAGAKAQSVLLGRGAPVQVELRLPVLRTTRGPAVPAQNPARNTVQIQIPGDYAVQLGAFRIHANAVAAAGRARAAGVPAVLSPAGALTLVRTAPLESRAEAADLAARLAREGLDAVVVAVR